ncbi:large conductance mechanosensitive channel protein [Venturia nashicola]|nr:large conductance mechanosensitive channel protein [Venturia nashicola]
MPRLPESTDEEQGTFEDYRHRAWDGASGFVQSFIDFALRDNVLEVAVGLIFAASFTAVANSLVSDILLPLFSCLPGLTHNLDESFLVLQQSSHSKITPKPGQKKPYYNTVQQALDDGAIVWAYGNFIDKLLRFILISLALFTVSLGWMVGRNHPDRQRTVLLRRNSTGDILAQPTGTWRTDPGLEIRTATSTWAFEDPDREGLRRSATTWNIGDSDFVSEAQVRRGSALSPPRSVPTWMSEPDDEYVGQTARGTPVGLSRKSTAMSDREPLLKRPTRRVPIYL